MSQKDTFCSKSLCKCYLKIPLQTIWWYVGGWNCLLWKWISFWVQGTKKQKKDIAGAFVCDLYEANEAKQSTELLLWGSVSSGDDLKCRYWEAQYFWELLFCDSSYFCNRRWWLSKYCIQTFIASPNVIFEQKKVLSHSNTDWLTGNFLGT